MSTEPAGVIFAAEELLPARWRAHVGDAPVRLFNPALIAYGSGWLFAYRVVAADGLRRIAACRLDRSLRVLPDSAVPLSDGFRFRAGTTYPDVVHTWFADPRLYWFGARLFVYWNSGWHEPQNHQFLHELDPLTLRPLGCAREFLLATGARQKLEKNWTLFGDGGDTIRAVYSIIPHRVLRASLAGDGDLAFADEAHVPWALPHYPPSHGGLRGGAPPQRVGNHFVSFCHSVHDGATGYCYAAAAYAFAAEPPFAPTLGPRGPLSLHNPYGHSRVHAALNPAVGEVIYPCGAVREGDRWLVSHGINDEHCAISVVSDAQLQNSLMPLPGAGG